jgi:hypothetical protein
MDHRQVPLDDALPILGLVTKQVDYVAAFVQGDIDTTVFVEIPRGFTQLD